MKIKRISIIIETEDTEIETTFVDKEEIAEIMNSDDKIKDLIRDILKNAQWEWEQ